MTSLTLARDFPLAALGLTFSLGCALIIAFVALRFVVGLVTREQYNVTDDPRRVRAIVFLGRRGNRGSANPGGSRGATGGPYLLAAAAPPNRFNRITKPVATDAGRSIQFSQRSERGTAQGRPGHDDHAA